MVCRSVLQYRNAAGVSQCVAVSQCSRISCLTRLCFPRFAGVCLPRRCVAVCCSVHCSGCCSGCVAVCCIAVTYICLAWSAGALQWHMYVLCCSDIWMSCVAVTHLCLVLQWHIYILDVLRCSHIPRQHTLQHNTNLQTSRLGVCKSRTEKCIRLIR